MKNLNFIFNEIKAFPLKASCNIIQQTSRNELKQLILNALAKDLGELDARVGFVDDGIAIEIKNDDLGEFVGVVNITLKGLDYKFDTETEKHQANLEAKALKKEASRRERERRFEEAQRRKELKKKA